MTAHHRRTDHKMLAKRQGPNDGANPKPGNPGGGPDVSPPVVSFPGPSSSSVQPPSSSQHPSSSSAKPSSSSTPPPPSSSSTPPPPSTTVESSSSTSASSSASSAASSSSSSSLSSSRSTASRTLTPTPSTTLGANRGQTSQFRTASGISIGAGETVTAESSAGQTSGISTGTVVGGVAGGLAALAILGILVVFILRKLKNRKREDEDFGTDFRRSAFVTDSRPSSMAPKGHNVAPSIASAGIAGQGAPYGATAYSDATSPVTNYGATTAASQAAAAAAAATLQERPKYVYGQPNPAQNLIDDDASDHAHGAYSSQPQMINSYNPEAYGSYAAYDNAAGYQDATRQYQGQDGYAVGDNAAYGQYGQPTSYAHPYGHDANQYAQYEQQQQYAQQGQYEQQGQYAQYDASAYAVTTDGAAAGAAATAAGAHKTSASRNQDDAYGGI